MRKHIDGLYFFNNISGGKQLQITGLGGCIATYIYDFWCGYFEQLGYQLLMKAGTRRIYNDNVRLSMFCKEGMVADVDDIAGKKISASDVVQRSISCASAIASFTASTPMILPATLLR